MPLADLLNEALPGQEIGTRGKRPARSDELPEMPWKFWRTTDHTWAVYVAVGKKLSQAAIDSLHQAPTLGFRPVILAQDGDQIKVAAQHFQSVPVDVVCEVAGTGQLIRPTPPVAAAGARRTSAWRIDRRLIGNLVQHANAPRYLRNYLETLCNSYRDIADIRRDRDGKEYDLLHAYGEKVLKKMEFTADVLSGAEMIRRIEQIGWGGARDHFFHSFQNYFFGLYAVLELEQHFNNYRDTAQLQWQVDPFHLWFLIALWHDVGYGIEKFPTMTDDIFGEDEDGESASRTVEDFLYRPIIQEALTNISCLMWHMTQPGRARTAWLPPRADYQLSRNEKRLRESLIHNVLGGSHGSASALRLYGECMPKLRRRGPAQRLLLEQTVLLACCSMPYHDWHFRKCVREECGTCQIPVATLPFAALLAFVDSIQDDRRDLAGLQNELYFLERLLVDAPATVTARVDRNAVPDTSVLWKLIEARDVTASLRNHDNGLTFTYPEWMAGANV